MSEINHFLIQLTQESFQKSMPFRCELLSRFGIHFIL